MTNKLRTVYCSQNSPVAGDLARKTWGEDALIGFQGQPAPEGRRIVGYVAAHRSGPRIPVHVAE